MLTYVSAAWVEEHLTSPEVLVLDPRSPLRYMAGHPKGAINAHIAKARDASGNLRSIPELARWLGSVGLDEKHTPVIYDNADGRSAAMLAWILQYLGRDDVHLMETLWEKWVADKREVFYKPVAPVAREFQAKPRLELRATIDQVAAAKTARLVDFRSRDEYAGKVDNTGRPGHIPGAVNVVWQELAGQNGNLLAADEDLRKVLSTAEIKPGRPAIAYCLLGARAALGFLALEKLGQPVALYDGSYTEWAKSSNPVVAPEPKAKTENA
jgi:thiosulfate/3-mercaptopyruvate sulfurtransferase